MPHVLRVCHLLVVNAFQSARGDETKWRQTVVVGYLKGNPKWKVCEDGALEYRLMFPNENSDVTIRLTPDNGIVNVSYGSY